MADLTTTYMGLKLRNPLIAGSSSLTATVNGVMELQDAGVGAVVLKSIFEEQIRMDVRDTYDTLDTAMHAEAYEYIRADLPMRLGPEKYLERLEAIKRVAQVPVIASINCTTPAEWTEFARQVEAVGADAVELNIYDIPSDPAVTGAEVEARHLEVVSSVKSEIELPVAVKIGPFYSAPLAFGRNMDKQGADALVLFNRFFQPDINVDTLELESAVHFSRSEDLLVPLRWTALLREQVSCDLALSGGVHVAEDAVKALLAGADAVQVCSAIYEHGAAHVTALLDGMTSWMEDKGYGAVSDFRGHMRERDLDAKTGFERAQYIKALAGLE